ncbi:hypothetical protein WUBG_02787 [Wuchereria bancrofti]|uniref:Uncharacterized protein n=1 Tax=Wuchereria bancrofti TaxID=6293 RepID=J9FG31_WUCBA|nr:hypothetical protein WUBG_02787 [Wuchereria bancrofti]
MTIIERTHSAISIRSVINDTERNIPTNINMSPMPIIRDYQQIPAYINETETKMNAMEKSVIDLVLLHCKLSSAADSNPSTSFYPTAMLFFPNPSLRLDFQPSSSSPLSLLSSSSLSPPSSSPLSSFHNHHYHHPHNPSSLPAK